MDLFLKVFLFMLHTFYKCSSPAFPFVSAAIVYLTFMSLVCQQNNPLFFSSLGNITNQHVFFLDTRTRHHVRFFHVPLFARLSLLPHSRLRALSTQAEAAPVLPGERSSSLKRQRHCTPELGYNCFHFMRHINGEVK